MHKVLAVLSVFCSASQAVALEPVTLDTLVSAGTDTALSATVGKVGEPGKLRYIPQSTPIDRQTIVR